MLGVARIPVEMRWRLVSRMLTFIPLAYDEALRSKVGESYNAHVVALTREIADDISPYIAAFQVPAQSAADAATILLAFSSILFGPDYETEPVEGSEKKAVIRFTACPFMAVAQERGCDPGHAFVICTTFNHHILKKLSPEYSIITSRAKCIGDPVCEMTIRHHG